MDLFTDKMSWSRMISFMLTNFEAILKNIGLYGAIRNVQYSLLHSVSYLFSILKMYNPKSKTLFNPIGELGFVLH